MDIDEKIKMIKGWLDNEAAEDDVEDLFNYIWPPELNPYLLTGEELQKAENAEIKGS